MEGRAVIDELLRSRRVLHIAACIRLRKRVPVLRRRIDESRLAVIDLVNARVLHKGEIDGPARDRAVAVDLPAAFFEFLPAEGIVLDLDWVSARRDVVHDLRRFECICRRVFRRRGELCAAARKAERHIVARDDTRPGTAARHNRPAGRDIVDIRPVILLCCIRHGAKGINDVEVVRVKVAAVDCPLAVGIRVHGVVARRGCPKLCAERILHVRVLHIMLYAVARVGIRRKRRPREAAVIAVIVPR